MKDTVGNFVSFIEKAVILIILVSTITAIVFEILKMIDAKYVELADLLLLFIYVEVIGMVRVYMISNRVRMTYPLFIAITALSRLIILQGKDSNPELLLYEAGAIVLVAIAVVILRLRYIPILRPFEMWMKYPQKILRKIIILKKIAVIGTGLSALSLAHHLPSLDITFLKNHGDRVVVFQLEGMKTMPLTMVLII